jgi:subtilisin family serine protease
MNSGESAPFRVVSRDELDRLLAQDRLEWYEPDGTVYLLDPLPEAGTAALLGALSPWYADEMWHLDMIAAETAYELDATGEGVRVAVIDSGANQHPDLEGRLAEGWNYLRNNASTGDSNGHGTAVCGLIAGGGEGGMVGAAPKAILIPLKAFEGTTTRVSTVCQAIWAAVDDYDCDVINMSLGATDDSVALQEAIAHAVENGVIVVAAAGNGGTRTKYYPASYDEVIGVGNVDSSGMVYKNSNHNESVFLTAPGTMVVSLDRLGGYNTFTGCSFSTPLVTGTVADLLSLERDLTRKDVFTILSATAMDRGGEGWDEYYGWGILNLRGSVLALEPELDFLLTAPWTEDGRQYTAAVNHTDTDAACLLITARYDGNGQQKTVTVEPRLLPAHGREILALPQDDCKVFLCGADFHPLARTLEVRHEPE